MGDWIWIFVPLVALPIWGRCIAWFADPTRPDFGWGDTVGRLVFGKRWDYPLGKPEALENDGETTP